KITVYYCPDLNMVELIIYNIMNSLKKLFLLGSFIASLILLVQPVAMADDVLWKSGLNLYIKITDQDNKSKPNQHPVTLDAREISNALNLMQIVDRKFAQDDELKTVFTIQQATLLGQ